MLRDPEPSGTSKLAKGEKWGMAAVIAVMAALFWSMLCSAPTVPWNTARLSPSFALARGLPIYALRDSGAHLGWVYGPVFPLCYLPAGITDNPTLGLMIAVVLNIVALALPMFLVFRATLGGFRGIALQMTLLGTALLLANPITNIAFYFIHVDRLCIGWALVACVALHARVTRSWRPGFPVAAVAVALAVATKQVAVVLIPATLIWLWHEGHGRLLLRWIFWLATICGALAAACFAAFGAEEVLFNAWLLFSRMPWRGGWAMAGTNLLEVLASCWLWCLGGFLAWLTMRTIKDVRPAAEAGSFARLLGWIALVQAPLGLTASLIVDAELNSIHAPTYLLMAGLVLSGSMLGRWRESTISTKSIRPWFALGFITLLAVCTDLWLVLKWPGVVWTPYRGLEEVLAAVRHSPGKIYMPWNPLVTIIAERKIYPFDEALHYLWLSRLEPPHAAIRAAVTEGAFIIYHEPCQSHFALNYFGPEPHAKEVHP